MPDQSKTITRLRLDLNKANKLNGNLHSQVAMLSDDNDRKTKKLANLRSLVRAVARAAEEAE